MMNALTFLVNLLRFALGLAILVGIIAGIVVLVRRGRGERDYLDAPEIGAAVSAARVPRTPVTWERFFLYILSFAGLMATLFGLYGLLAVSIGLIVQHITTLGTLISISDAKTQVADGLAALIVGALLWLGCWRVVQRRVARLPEEREALERRLYLGAIFAVTAIVSLFSLQTCLKSILGLPGSANNLLSVRDTVRTGLELLTFGTAWLAYARLGRREREPRTADLAHDLAVYAVAGLGLIFLSFGLGDAIHHLLMALQGTAESDTTAVVSNASWVTWGEVASWILAGGVVWGAIWRYDLSRGGARPARVGYLYLVLTAAVPPAVVSAGIVVYELLRRSTGYVDSPNTWSFLVDALPVLAVAAGVWAYHWLVMRDQVALFRRQPIVSGAIAWPRRPAIAAISFAGLAAATFGAVTVLWVGINALLATHDAGVWWRDMLCAGIATILVGLAMWGPAWAILQRAASADPRRERDARSRRWLLVAIVVGGALTAIGFSVATLYQVLRGILQTADPNTLSSGFRFGSATLVLAAIAGCHALVLRRERSQRGPAPSQLRVGALIAPGAEETVAQLRQRTGLQIERLGYLDADTSAPVLTPAALETQLLALSTGGTIERALLILQADGGTLYPYTRTPLQKKDPAPRVRNRVLSPRG